MANVKITLKKSLIGRLEKQILTARSLGLRKIGDSLCEHTSLSATCTCCNKERPIYMIGNFFLPRRKYYFTHLTVLP